MFSFDLKKKNLLNYISCLIAVLALVTLIIYSVYIGKGGSYNAFVIVACILAIVCEAFLFVYDGAFAGIIGAVSTLFLVLAMMLNLESGIGNILDNINNFHIYGEASLAGLNVAVAIIAGIATIISIVSCFFKKEKAVA